MRWKTSHQKPRPPLFYLSWTEGDIRGLKHELIQEVWTEVDSAGFVWRELHFGLDGHLSGMAPKYKEHCGFFDNVPVAVEGLKSNLRPEQFEERWKEACEKYGQGGPAI